MLRWRIGNAKRSRSIVRLELEEGENPARVFPIAAASTVLVSMGQADVVPGQAAVRGDLSRGGDSFRGGPGQRRISADRGVRPPGRSAPDGRERVVGESVDTEVELAPLELSAK